MSAAIYLSIAIFLISLQAMCQVQPLENAIENQIDLPGNEDVDPEVYLAAMNATFPIDINGPDLYLLVKEQVISRREYETILEHRKLYGNIICLEELQVSIKETDQIKKLRPYVTFESSNRVSYINKQSSFMLTRLSSTLEMKKGFRIGNYERHRWNQMHKLRFDVSKHVSLGATLENDAGEPLFSGLNKNRFDFQSFHILYHHAPKRIKLVTGDFGIRTGQGLVLNTTYTTGETLAGESLCQPQSLLKAYTSANEGNFLRGLALQKVSENFEYIVYASHANRGFTLNEANNFSSFTITGLHRTMHEQLKKSNCQEKTAGVHLKFKKNHFALGTTISNYWFSHAFQPNNEILAAQFTPGKNYMKIGADVLLIHKNQTYFAELASDDKHQTLNFIGGTLFALSRHVSVGIVYLRYSHRFFTYHSNALGKNSSNTNEESFYTKSTLEIGSFKLFLNWMISHQPFMMSEIHGREKTYRETFQIEKTEKNIYSCYLRLQHQQERIFQQEIKYRRFRCRIHLRTFLGKQLVFTNRYEIIYFTKPLKKTGRLSYHEIQQNFPKAGVKIKFRVCPFQTDDYDTRIWAYESNVPHSFEFPSFSNQGFRFYFIMVITRIKNLSLSAKLGQTSWANKKNIDSGNELIEGNRRHSLTIQLHYKW